MKFLILIAATLLTSSAFARPTDGVLFGCTKKITAADGSYAIELAVDGTIPISGTSRFAIHYKNSGGEVAFINESEKNFRVSQGDDLEKRYGKQTTTVQNSVPIIAVDFQRREISAIVPVTVKIDGKDQPREVYLSSIPGTLLYSRNDETGKTATFKAVFTGIDPVNSTSQLTDFQVDCSLNDNFTK